MQRGLLHNIYAAAAAAALHPPASCSRVESGRAAYGIQIGKQSMAPHLPATCLGTLAFVTNQFPAAAAFSVALGIDKRQRNGRIRARLSSSKSDRSEDAGHRVPPPPERRSRADMSSPIVDLALLNPNAAGAGRPSGRPAGRTGSIKEQARSTSSGSLAASPRDDVPGRPARAAGRADVYPAVERQLASGNIIGAISLLASAADEIEVISRRNLNASDTAAAAAAAGINGAASDMPASLSEGFAAVLRSCAKRGLWREANQIITRHMPAAGVEASAADWLLAIDACAGPEGSEQAVFYLHDMRMRGFEITRDVYGAAVRACALSGGTGRALFLLKDSTKRGVPLPPPVVAAVMRAAGWQQALAIYDAFVELAAGQAQTRSASEETPGGVGRSLGDAGGDLPGSPRGQARQLHLLSEVAPGWEGVCQAALEACAKGGKWESALEILNVLRAGGGGAELSQEAYDKAIEVCGDAKAWDMVLLLVAEMRSDGVPTSPAAFETALKGCAATGSWLWARSLMSSVSADAASGIRLTVAHYLEALRSCAAVVDKPGGGQARSAANAALELLQDIREARWLSGRQGEDAYFWAMKTCIAAQDAWSALALLDSAQDDRVRRSMALRTAAMQACSGAGEWRAALSILDDVHLEGLRPSGAAYVAAMGACARGGVVDLALELLDKVLVEHPGDKKTITSGYHGAIVACAECGHWEGATSLLQRMRQDPLVVVTAKEYNAAILACCRAQQSVAALTLLGDMSLEEGAVAQDSMKGGNSGLRPDETSYICVMRSFGKERRWRTVLDLLGSMKEEAGLVPSVSTYNVVVEALAKAGEWQRALGVLSEMKREGIRPTEFTYNRCMTACEKSGQWEQTLSLMADMKGQGDLVPDSYMCSTAMMACSKAGRLDDVLGILQELRDMPGGQGPNLVNYNIAIGSCARARDWTRMLEEMDNMRWEDFKPEESTFSVPLDICGRSGDLSMALTLLARMRECKVKPGVVTFGSAVAAACRAGDAASAAVLLDEMEGAGHPPNEVTYGVAALACRDAANADAAVDLLRRRERQGLPPDPLILSFAVQACSKAGDLERGLDLITGMKSAGFVPDGLFYTGVIAGIGASFSPTRVRPGPVCDDD